MILGTFPPNSPQWHAARAGRIGGSTIAAVCGWSPFQTREDLMAEMVEGGNHEKRTKAIDRGHALEAAVADWWAADHGATFDAAASAATYVLDDRPWAMFNPDRVTTDGLLLEVKTTHNRDTEAGWGRAGTSKIPLYYSVQVTWGCGILGLTRWELTVLHGATNGRPDLARADYRGDFNPRGFAFLLGKAERFIDELHAAKEAAA